jgi:SAM-dependent methyltransferase
MIEVSVFKPDVQEAARSLAVVPDIHPEDFIFQFLVENPSFQNTKDAVNYYFSDGRKSAEKFESLVTEYLWIRERPIQLLEFASGFGCVSRHLVRSPTLHVTACDIHQKAIDFLRKRIGVEAVLSRSQPRDFVLGRKYDVCFALSFLSHVPESAWGSWLHRLYDLVNPGGLLIFTTHGYRSRRFFGSPSLNRDGYWFIGSSEQKDLSTAEYGQTVVTPGYVLNQIHLMNQIPNRARADLVFMQEGFWWAHQDTYVLRKEAPDLLAG